MKGFALVLIRLYQRHISPHKGFSCAYRFHTRRPSCSSHGYKAIAKHGVLLGVWLIKRRLKRCGDEHRKHLGKVVKSDPRMAYPSRQAGFCDAGCDVGDCGIGGCDAPDVGSCACDGLSGCSPSPCDSWDWRRRRSNEDKYVEVGLDSQDKAMHEEKHHA